MFRQNQFADIEPSFMIEGLERIRHPGFSSRSLAESTLSPKLYQVITFYITRLLLG